MSVLSALLYLRITSLKNFFRAQFRRLRQPKYLAGAVFVVAYFWFLVFRNVNTAFSKLNMRGMGDLGPLTLALGALAVTAVLAAMWIFSSDKPGLHFTEPEIAFLFPAPLARPVLIHYKLLSTLFGSLIQSFFFSLIFNRGNLLSGRAPQLLVGWWVMLSIISLHSLGTSLTIARLVEGGLQAGRRRLLIVGGLSAVAVATGWWIWHEMPDAGNYQSMFEWYGAVLNGGALHWLLWPAKLIVQPLVTVGLVEYFIALAPAVLLLVLHYWWVTKMDVAFEEASIARAAHFASRRAEIQTKGVFALGAKPAVGRRPPFELGRSRWVEFAFLWKNLLSTRPYFTPRNWLICAGIIVLLWQACEKWAGDGYILATIGTMSVGLALVYGPLITRLDIRQDLANADILKTYPLTGWRILLGQLLTPIAILSGIIWLGLLATYLGLHQDQPAALSMVWFNPMMRGMVAGCGAIIAPFLVMILLLVPNGAAILFPAAFKTARTPGAGLDLMGQRMIFGIGQIIILGFVLVPGGGAGVLFGFIAHELLKIGPAATLVFSTLISVLVFTGEIWCILWWLGERFEKLDLSAELRA